MSVARTVAMLGHAANGDGGSLTAPRRAVRSAEVVCKSQLAVRGLIFDMAGVLYDATLWRRWLVRLLARMGWTFDYQKFYEAWDAEYLSEVHRGRREYGEAFNAFLRDQGLSWAQIDEVEAASRVLQQELETGERPLPGVAATLGVLAERGLRLAVLTDSPFRSAHLEGQLSQLGLGGYFHAVISSCDVEAIKPEPAGYRAALAALDLEPADAAYVGHCEKSLGGAAQLGLRTIAFNHFDHSFADIYITRFAELLGIVGETSA